MFRKKNLTVWSDYWMVASLYDFDGEESNWLLRSFCPGRFELDIKHPIVGMRGIDGSMGKLRYVRNCWDGGQVPATDVVNSSTVSGGELMEQAPFLGSCRNRYICSRGWWWYLQVPALLLDAATLCGHRQLEVYGSPVKMEVNFPGRAYGRFCGRRCFGSRLCWCLTIHEFISIIVFVHFTNFLDIVVVFDPARYFFSVGDGKENLSNWQSERSERKGAWIGASVVIAVVVAAAEFNVKKVDAWPTVCMLTWAIMSISAYILSLSDSLLFTRLASIVSNLADWRWLDSSNLWSKSSKWGNCCSMRSIRSVLIRSFRSNSFC